MDSILEIVPFHFRRFAEIPVDEIKVMNSRNRDKEQFDMNVQSIDSVGLLKPIRVNDKFRERSGVYELICGEGRLLAHKRLGRDKIKAEVVTCTRKDAYLQSLIENLARTQPGTMDHARELKRMHDEGWGYKDIARVAGRNEQYVREYIRLVQQGEDRLIQGVERGVFTMEFALRVAASDDANLQNILMDAFDAGMVTAANFSQARKIITARARTGRSKTVSPKYTVTQLKQDITDATKAKTSYVREAKSKENRFVTLFDGINALWKDAELVQILRAENLLKRPALGGDFQYES
jgi:ParB family chromosome partitioning protein